MTPGVEMTRPIHADRVAPGLVVPVTATAAECVAIAARLMVPSVEAVECRWVLHAAPDSAVEAEGSLRARLSQTCVVSLDVFPVALVEEFAVRFVPARRDADRPGEAGQGERGADGGDDPDEPDELPIVDGILDLGEATVEQLALALDPYPRKPDATLPGAAGEPSANPFAALAKWRPSE